MRSARLTASILKLVDRATGRSPRFSIPWLPRALQPRRPFLADQLLANSSHSSSDTNCDFDTKSDGTESLSISSLYSCRYLSYQTRFANPLSNELCRNHLVALTRSAGDRAVPVHFDLLGTSQSVTHSSPPKFIAT